MRYCNYVVRAEGRECIYCWLFKGWDEFSPDASRKIQGRRSQCKRCSVVMAWRWNQANRERIRERDQRRRAGQPPTERTCVVCDDRVQNVKGKAVCASCKEATKHKKWERERLARYGLTAEEFSELVEAQHGRCAVNPAHILPASRNADVDHCHVTGIVRGLICHSCNVMLGMSGDDPETLELGAAYLRQARQLRLLA